MKKILSLLLTAAMLLGTFSFSAFAETFATPDANGYYVNEGFDIGLGDFEATNTNVTLSVVPSTTEGVGGNGNVLQITSTAADSSNIGDFGADIVFENPIPVDKKLVFETRIKAPNNTGSYKYLFAMYGGNKGKCYGLARLVTPGGGNNFYSVNPSSGTRWDATNPLKNDNGEIITLTTTDWYRIKVVYNNGVTESISLYSDAGDLIATGDYTEYATQNHAYPPAQIDKIRFAQAAADTIYLDEVKIYEYSDLAVANSFNTTYPAGATTITIPFNKELDDTTLNDITVVGVNAANPTIISKDVDGSDLIITLAEGLVGCASYLIDLTGLTAADGSELVAPSVTIQTEAAPAEGMYINATFESGVNPFNVVSNTLTGTSAGTVAIVDATTDAVVGDGKVLKISSTASGNIISASAELSTPISLDENPVVFEARFMNSGSYAENKSLFGLYSHTHSNRTRATGLAYMSRPQNVNSALGTYYNYSVFANGPAKTCFMDPENTTAPVVLAGDTWYRIKIVYDETGEKTMVKSMQLYDANDNLIQSIANCETDNSGYPLTDISKISFGISKTWGNTHTLYLDDVKVYDYSALLVDDSFDGSLSAGATTITIPFNKELDNTTLNDITVVGVNAANPTIISKDVDGSDLIITLAEGVIGSASYRVNLTGLAALDGSVPDEVFVLLQTEAASVEGMYINATFEDGVNPFNVVSNTLTGSSAGTVAIVDATTDAVVGEGKVLKISSAASGNIISASAELSTPISLAENPVVFEARFMNSGGYAENKSLFGLYSHSVPNRTRATGLAYMSRPQNVNSALGTYYNYSVFANGPAKTCFMDPENTTAPVVLAGNTWYRIKIVYDETGEKTMIQSMQLFDANDNLIQSITNCETDSSGYPLTDISKISFGISKTWGNEHILYLDDVKVYDMPEPLAFIGATITNGAEISPVSTDSVVLSFSERINHLSLNNIVVTANGSPVAYEADLVGDSTQVQVTFTGGLLGGKNYVVDYSTLADVNGSSVAGSVTFSTKSGLFVKDIVYTDNDIAAGATIRGAVNFYNATDSSAQATIIAAVYEKIGSAYQLTAVTPLINQSVAVGSVQIPIQVTVPSDASVTNTEVKVFVIEDMNTLKPILSKNFSEY